MSVESREKLLMQLRLYSARAGADSTLYLARKVLGYKDVEPSVHGELCKIVEDDTRKKKMILLPRGSFKTSLITIADSVRHVINNPNIRICIDNEVHEGSIKMLAEIKGHFQTNKFKIMYGNYVSKVGWKEESITVSQRKKTFKEPTIDTMGLDTPRVGMHYDRIICDDLCSDKNTETEASRKKIIQHFKLLFSLLEPGGTIVAIGTRWHFGDLYQYIIDQNELTQTEDDKFEIYIQSAIRDDGSYFFPQRLNKKFLDGQLFIQGSSIFNAQYQNSPINPEDAMFKTITYYKRLDEVPKKIYIGTTVDPALSESKRADFSTILTAGMDEWSNIWVLDYFRKKYKPYGIIKDMLIARQKWHPRVFGIETNLFQKMLKWEMQRIERKAGIMLPIQELNHTRSKRHRIDALEPYFEQGKIMIRKSMTELEMEILTYPKAKHEDLLDTLAMMLEVLRPPTIAGDGIKSEEEKREDFLREHKWLRRPNRVPGYVDDELGLDW